MSHGYLSIGKYALGDLGANENDFDWCSALTWRLGLGWDGVILFWPCIKIREPRDLWRLAPSKSSSLRCLILESLRCRRIQIEAQRWKFSTNMKLKASSMRNLPHNIEALGAKILVWEILMRYGGHVVIEEMLSARWTSKKIIKYEFHCRRKWFQNLIFILMCSDQIWSSFWTNFSPTFSPFW